MPRRIAPRRLVAASRHALGRALARVAALDVTRVLVRRPGAGDPVRTAPVACREIGADELAPFGASADVVEGMAAGRVRCFAAFDDEGGLIGHDFAATGNVPAGWNSGGADFGGIGIELPPGTAYLFKAWVAPRWRGRGVHGAVLRHAVGVLDAEGCKAIVTTTNWTNAAALAGFARAGFERRGLAAEAVVGGRRAFRVPPPVELSPTERVRLLRHRS